MNKEYVRQQVAKFLESDSEKYMEFWLNIHPEEVNIRSEKNTVIKKQIDEERGDEKKAKKGYMDDGVYGRIAGQQPYQELDFEKFSFKFLEHLARQKGRQDIIEAAEVIQKEDESYRRKKLRHFFYESLKTTNCVYFDYALYRDVKARMMEVRENVREMLQQREDVELLTISYDSFSFIADEEKAQEIQESINSQLEVSRLRRETFDSVVKFYNIGYFNKEGNWKNKNLSGTPYDDLKDRIAHSLMEIDFEQAYGHVQEEKRSRENNIPDHKLRDYVSSLTKIKKEVEEQ